MKKIAILTAGAACLGLLSSALHAQVPTRALTLSHSNANGVFVEWVLPVGAQSAAPSVVGSSEPLHLLPTFDDAGNLFFTQRNLGYIGSLNARSQITEWSLGAGSFPHDLTLVGETIILTEEGTNAIGQFNPEKNTIREWPIPTALAEPWHEARVGSNLYFSEANAQKVASLNLVTNEITEWVAPNPFPEGLDAAGTKVWFAEFNAGKIAVLNTLKNTITEYPLSGAAVSTDVSHLKIFEGKIFVTDQGPTSHYLAELDPSTNTVFEWLVPTANAATGDLVVTENECNGKEGFLITFSEFQGGNVATLNTAIQAPDSSVVVTPIVTPETPVTTHVVPVTRSLSPVVTKLTPVITKVTGVVTGGFIEWAVPTLLSGPGGVATLGDDILLFTERSGNKIGALLH